jgi:hypothetical protein
VFPDEETDLFWALGELWEGQLCFEGSLSWIIVGHIEYVDYVAFAFARVRWGASRWRMEMQAAQEEL